MELFPAIDLFEKKAVRLLHGDYAKMTVYSDNPLSVAEDFIACGARNIHMVDLEGAKDGATPNLAVVEAVAKDGRLSVEVGGGIRSCDTVQRYIDAGVSRVILGTAAVTDPKLLEELVGAYREKIAVSVDLKDGFVAIKGWTQQSSLTAQAMCERLVSIGVKTVICTDISRDGAMKGTNRELYRKLNDAYPLNFIASGGVSSMEDVKALSAMKLYGAIIGKAYYTGAINLKEAIEVTR